MATIERQYLPPLNPEISIVEADRPRVYDIVRRQLGDLLEGDQSYYPDGVQKDWQARAEDLDAYIRSFTSLKGRVNDPADILGDVIGHLGRHAKNFRDRIEEAGPSDSIELPPAQSPTTRDRNELYLEPNPIAPPMKTLPQPRREWPIFVDLWKRRGQRGGQARAAHRATNLLPVLGKPPSIFSLYRPVDQLDHDRRMRHERGRQEFHRTRRIHHRKSLW